MQMTSCQLPVAKFTALYNGKFVVPYGIPIKETPSRLTADLLIVVITLGRLISSLVIGEHPKVSLFVTTVGAVVTRPTIATKGTPGYPGILEPKLPATLLPHITDHPRETREGLYVISGTRRGH